jgi:hypothetical protein
VLKLTAVELPEGLSLPNLEFVSESLSRHLVNLGMSEAKSQATSNFVRRERKEGDPSYSLDVLRESQTDVLGSYCTDLREAEVTLYVDNCMRTSKDISVKVDDLLQIVLVHEIAHHATASAVVEVSDLGPIHTWRDYNDCHGGSWTSVNEFFAQTLTLVCIVEDHPNLLGGFRKLSREQPSVYRAWEPFDSLIQNEVEPYSIHAALQAVVLGFIAK